MEKELTILENPSYKEGCHKVKVPSDDEVMALNEMRKIKNRISA